MNTDSAQLIALAVIKLRDCKAGTLEVTHTENDTLIITGEHQQTGYKLKLVFSYSYIRFKDRIEFGTQFKESYHCDFSVNDAKAFGNMEVKLETIRTITKDIKATIKSEKRFDATDAYNFITD